MLASGSPQRKTLLAQAVDRFEVIVADVDETPPPGPLREVVRAIARRKASAVAARGVQGTLLAADTVIDLDGELLGKPDGAAGALAMLERLAGRAHQVHSGVALLWQRAGRLHAVDGVATSTVRFRAVARDELAAYVATGEPMGKSGSYAIQGGAARFLESLEGEVDNVVGLPMRLVGELATRLASRVATASGGAARHDAR